MRANQPDRVRRIVRLVFLISGLLLVLAAILLLLLADLPAAVSAAMGVPGLGLIAASQLTNARPDAAA